MEVDLPTVGVGVDPSLDVHADAAFVRSVLDGIDGPVVLCGNSYGGVVITEASAGHPSVAHLVYLAAFMPDADDELASFLPNNATPEFMAGAVFRDDGLVELKAEVAAELVFQQAPADVIEWATAQTRPMAMGAGGIPTVTGVGWRDIESTCVVCSEDLTIHPDSQRHWAKTRATHAIEDRVRSPVRPRSTTDAGCPRRSSRRRPR